MGKIFFGNKKLLAALSVVSAIATMSALALAGEQAKPKPRKIRWLIAHEPIDVFKRAAKNFNEALNKESGGTLELQVLTPSDVGQSDGNVPSKKIFHMLAAGKVDMSQTVTTGIGELEKKFWVLDLPFLFKNHEHAAKVLEGDVGQKLLASLEKDKLHGLAFTYSGGFRVIPSLSKGIHNVDDFKGLKVRTTNSPVAQETLKLLGAVPVETPLTAAKAKLEAKTVDAAETTYVRYNTVGSKDSKYVNETFHSLFLTALIAGDKFYSSLTPLEQQALRRAAIQAARIERADSLRDGEQVKQELLKNGHELVKMSDSDRKVFESKVQPVYQKFEPVFGKDLIQEIQNSAL